MLRDNSLNCEFEPSTGTKYVCLNYMVKSKLKALSDRGEKIKFEGEFTSVITEIFSIFCNEKP